MIITCTILKLQKTEILLSWTAYEQRKTITLDTLFRQINNTISWLDSGILVSVRVHLRGDGQLC